MDYQPLSSSPTRREIIGAWVLCAVVAALVFGLAENLRTGAPVTAAQATEISPPTVISSSLRPS
jgi:hypothetical protein